MPTGELKVTLGSLTSDSHATPSGNIVYAVLGDASSSSACGVLLASEANIILDNVSLVSVCAAAAEGSLNATLENARTETFGMVFTGITAPYEDVLSWTGHPLTGSRVRVRIGNLSGIFSQPNEFGLFAGTGWDANSGMPPSSDSQYIRLGNLANEFHNVPINLYKNGVTTMQMEPSDPSFSMGNPLPGGYDSGIGLWQGRDTDGIYKWRVGDPSATGSSLSWNGSSLALRNSSLDIGGYGVHFAIGNPPPTSSSSGTGIWIDNGGLYGIYNGVEQIFIDTVDGKFYASGGTVLGVNPILGDLFISGDLRLGIDGKLLQGTGGWGIDFTGSAIWNDSGIMNIGGWNNNVKQWWGGSDGKFYADEGNVKIDKFGITISTNNINNAQLNRYGMRLYNPTYDMYENSSITFIGTSDPAHQTTIGILRGYSAYESNNFELVTRPNGFYASPLSSVKLRSESDYYSIAKIEVGNDTEDTYGQITLSHTNGNSLLSLVASEINLSGSVNTIGNLVVDGTIKDGAGIAYQNPTGWTPDTDTWTYVNSTSFKIANKDIRARFPVGTKIKLTQTSVKYFYVISTAYSTDTTVTVTGGNTYSLANAAITSPHYSYADNPQGFPRTPGGLITPSSPLWAGTANAPLTSTSWDGDTKTTTDRATVDLSAVFGVPAGVKAVLMTVQTQGDAVNDYILFGPNSSYHYTLMCRTLVAGVINIVSGVVPCDSNGDVYCYPSGTIEGVSVLIWGYWL